MANKWQMAKAFGRATFGKNNKENPTIKAVRDSYRRDLDNYVKDKDAAERAEAFNRGNEEAWLDGRSIVRDKDGRPDVRLESKDVAEARGDARLDDELQRDFDEGFEEAFKKESDWLEKGWLRDPDKKFGGMPKFSDDEYQWLGSTFYADKADRDKYIRDKMIKELQDGLPLSDFVERYRTRGR